MKKLCVSYANCEGGAVCHFLRKTPLADEFEFVHWNNYQLILLEQDRNTFFDSLHLADLILNQPTRPLDCRDGFQIPASDDLFNLHVRASVPRISYAYQWNSGFFPILKLGPTFEGWETGSDIRTVLQRRPGVVRDLHKERELLRRFDVDLLLFDCARRFIEAIAEQSRREQTCDVKMVDWILANYQTQRLFLTQNHPASALFAELAKRIHNEIIERLCHKEEKLYPAHDAMAENSRLSRMVIPSIPFDGVNDAGLPGAMPVHPAVVRELNLKYPADQDQSVFRTLLEQFVADPDK